VANYRCGKLSISPQEATGTVRSATADNPQVPGALSHH